MGSARRGAVAAALLSVVALLLLGGATCRPVGPREVTEQRDAGERGALDRLREPGAARLVTAQRHDNGSRLVLVDEHGLRLRDLTPIGDAKAIDANPSWSPDGAWVAYASSRGRTDPASTSIWIAPVFGGDPVRLTDDAGVDLTPAFSPDGKLVAFASNRAGGFDLWVVEVALEREGKPRAPRRITDGPESEIAPSWSPDGKLVYTVSDGARSWIAVANGDGSDARPLTQGPGDAWASVSPDGNTIVISARAEGRSDLDLWLIDARGGNRRRLADSSIGDETGGRFTHDGRWVFATSVVKTERGQAVWSSVVFVPVDGDGALRALYDTTPVPRHGVDPAPVPLDAAALAEAPGYREALRGALKTAAPGVVE